MRISDWSSDVCSSDLRGGGQNGRQKPGEAVGPFQPDGPADLEQSGENENGPSHGAPSFRSVPGPSPAMSGRLRGRPRNRLLSGAIGRASCRERVCQYVLISVVAGTIKKQNKHT